MNKENEGRLRNRFQKGIDKAVVKFLTSVPFDWRLYYQDIAGSIAHAQMLAKQQIISEKDSGLIVAGLISIREEIEEGEFRFKPDLEDVHMNIESRLFEKIGDVAGKLHTARSRNDQITLDMRLFLKDKISETTTKLKNLQRVLINVAETNKDAIMPGYTHLQQAQPILFAHYMLAYYEMFCRDISRFQDCFKRVNVLPLGSGALAGVAYDIDRDFVAEKLGFNDISANSLDAVSDRDFVIEYEAAAAITMMHLSRLAEEMILWSSNEFNFIEMDEAYTTSSSIMPQKKNPDVAEIIRGKTGRVYGHLLGILTVMKGLPLAYNRDMQEDKEGLFDTIDTLVSSLGAMSGLVETMKINGTRMRESINSYILATDLADYLVKKGLPFREAHNIIGKLVLYALNKNKGLQELEMQEYRNFSTMFAEDIYAITVETSIASRISSGGTGPQQVIDNIAKAKKKLNQTDEK